MVFSTKRTKIFQPKKICDNFLRQTKIRGTWHCSCRLLSLLPPWHDASVCNWQPTEYPRCSQQTYHRPDHF